jgi:hypothetical protein
MKTTTYPVVLAQTAKRNLQSLLTVLFLLNFSVSFSQIKFTNPSQEPNTGAAKSVGSVYRFKSVIPTIDALVRVDSLVNGSSIVDIDEIGFGFDDAFQPRVQAGGNGISYAVFSVKFVKENTTSPVFLASLTTTNIDLDGNNNLHEFCEFDLGTGANATYMGGTPEISVSQKSSKFLGQNVAGNEYNGIDTSADAVMFKVKRNNVHQFTVRLGAIVTNNCQAARQYSVYMKDFQITNALTLPVSLLNFQANVKNNKVTLNWTSANEINFSHFVVQHSTDGVNFTDAATVMGRGSVASVNQYQFDNTVDNNSKTHYYRLLMIDANGKYDYSAVRMIRIIKENNVSVSVFPNPVVNEVRVTVPENWQQKQVVYEIYNSNGQLMNRVQSQSAAQIQQINMSSYQNGAYTVKVSNGQESLVKQIIKN